MSGQVKFSYVEAFLQKTIPSITDVKLISTKRALRNKPILLTAEKKATKSSKLKKSQQKSRVKKRILAKPANSNYASYEQLRILWKDYILTLLDDYKKGKSEESNGDLDLKNVQDVLLKADYHGANITVADSPCQSMNGVHGTVLQVGCYCKIFYFYCFAEFYYRLCKTSHLFLWGHSELLMII